MPKGWSENAVTFCANLRWFVFGVQISASRWVGNPACSLTPWGPHAAPALSCRSFGADMLCLSCVCWLKLLRAFNADLHVAGVSTKLLLLPVSLSCGFYMLGSSNSLLFSTNAAFASTPKPLACRTTICCAAICLEAAVAGEYPELLLMQRLRHALPCLSQAASRPHTAVPVPAGTNGLFTE